MTGRAACARVPAPASALPLLTPTSTCTVARAQPMSPSAWFARSSSAARSTPAVRAVGQDGGVVSALLVWGLRTGRIEAALTAARDGERPLEGRPTIATDEAGVLAAAGSRYTYCPTPLILPDAVARGLKRIAVVGTGCQASLPAVMGAHRLARWRNRVSWTFGLLCSKTFTYDGLVEGRIAGEFGMDPDRVGRIDIKGRIIVEGPDGDTRTIPLREAAPWTRPGCVACPDFAAEHADLSFGGLGQSDRWTLVLVRTALGQQVWGDTIGAGVVEQRAVEPSTLSLHGPTDANEPRQRGVVRPGGPRSLSPRSHVSSTHGSMRRCGVGWLGGRQVPKPRSRRALSR